MTIQSFEQFCQEFHPEVLEQYKRKITPNYYECGILYYLQRDGCGGLGKNYKKLVLDNCTMYKDSMHFNLYDVDKPEDRYIILEKEAFYSLKRVDENVEYKYTIVNDGRVRYVTVGGKEYQIQQMYFRDYYTQRLAFKIWVTTEDSPVWWDYYNVIGKGEPVLRTVKNRADSFEREVYDIKFKISVRQFKEIVFGSPDIKIPRL